MPHFAPPGHLYHVSSLTLSNDATASFVLQNSVYKDYLFIFENVTPTADAALSMLTSTDGGSNYDAGASDYAWVRRILSATTSPFEANAGDDAHTDITLAQGGTDVGEDISGILWLFGPAAASFTHVRGEWQGRINDGNEYAQWTGGTRLSAADVDAVRFLFVTGNLESGVIRMYGLRAA